LLRFFQKAIAFRHTHSALRSDRFFDHWDRVGAGIPDIGFHGNEPYSPDFSSWSRCLAFMLSGKHAAQPDTDIYVAINMYWDGLPFRLPKPTTSQNWQVSINTSMPSPEDVFDPGKGPTINTDTVIVGPRSVIVLTAV
jgi:isoamylase